MSLSLKDAVGAPYAKIKVFALSQADKNRMDTRAAKLQRKMKNLVKGDLAKDENVHQLLQEGLGAVYLLRQEEEKAKEMEYKYLEMYKKRDTLDTVSRGVQARFKQKIAELEKKLGLKDDEHAVKLRMVTLEAEKKVAEARAIEARTNQVMKEHQESVATTISDVKERLDKDTASRQKLVEENERLNKLLVAMRERDELEREKAAADRAHTVALIEKVQTIAGDATGRNEELVAQVKARTEALADTTRELKTTMEKLHIAETKCSLMEKNTADTMEQFEKYKAQVQKFTEAHADMQRRLKKAVQEKSQAETRLKKMERQMRDALEKMTATKRENGQLRVKLAEAKK